MEVSLDGLLLLEDEALAALVYPAEKLEGADPRLTDFESRKDYFLRQLPRTGVTRQLLWLEYKRACPEGFQYAKFCSLLATEQRIRQATMANLEHNPADMMQVDFAGEPLFLL